MGALRCSYLQQHNLDCCCSDAICVIAGMLAVRAKSPRFDVMTMFPMFILVGFLCVAGVYFAV